MLASRARDCTKLRENKLASDGGLLTVSRLESPDPHTLFVGREQMLKSISTEILSYSGASLTTRKVLPGFQEVREISSDHFTSGIELRY
ncbi:hypothetical protein Trydic_g17363 [Trypoxylus dichotomus]